MTRLEIFKKCHGHHCATNAQHLLSRFSSGDEFERFELSHGHLLFLPVCCWMGFQHLLVVSNTLSRIPIEQVCWERRCNSFAIGEQRVVKRHSRWTISKIARSGNSSKPRQNAQRRFQRYKLIYHSLSRFSCSIAFSEGTTCSFIV